MTVSVRLDPVTERMLARLAKITGKTKSDLIREAIRRFSERASEGGGDLAVYDRFADVVGVVNLGPGNRAARSEQILRTMFAARRVER